ncbi:MAG: hypothetical protein AB7O97_12985 [Planctomycetota bacterium]
MIPRELIGTAAIPGAPGELRCYRHDGAFAFWLEGKELMSSRATGSEEQLAELALAALPPAAMTSARVLVGGLGMGFTLARALALVGERAEVEVAELVPEVVTWNRELLGHCAGHPLQDRRTRLFQGDVAARIAAASSHFHAILLDVDNGPEALVRRANDALYHANGLRAARRALVRHGVLAVWSSRGDDAFARRLARNGFRAAEHRVRARRTKGPVRTLWVATPA